MVPARQLVGLTLDGPWTVTELLERPASATGGCFSQGYRVVGADGTKAFLKALDYTGALAESDDPARVLEALTTAYNYERDLLAKCKGRRMSRVVTILADGKVRVSDSVDGVVQYLIFGEFRVCSGRADTFEGGVRQFRECRIMSCIGAFLESRPRGTWIRWS